MIKLKKVDQKAIKTSSLLIDVFGIIYKKLDYDDDIYDLEDEEQENFFSYLTAIIIIYKIAMRDINDYINELSYYRRNYIRYYKRNDKNK
jgi:hypothetical protein